MTLVGWAQITLVLAVVLGCAIPLSKFIAEVYAGEKNCSVSCSDRLRAAFIA
jgi:hypothetical protein